MISLRKTLKNWSKKEILKKRQNKSFVTSSLFQNLLDGMYYLTLHQI